MNIWQIHFNILTLKAKPQDLPVSKNHLLLLALIVSATHIASMLLSIGPKPETLKVEHVYSALTVLALDYLMIKLILLWCRKTERMLQTMSALWGNDVILSILGLIIGILFLNTAASEQLFLTAGLLIFLWSFIIRCRVLYEATELTYGTLIPLNILIILFMIFITAGI